MIAYINGNTSEENPLSVPVNVITHKLPRRSKVYQLGTELGDDGVFSFQISFIREQANPIMADERDAIAHWLTSDFTYRPLRIIQDDMCSIYYNCYFQNLSYITIDGYANGFTATVICDAPFAWKNPQTKEKINQPISEGRYPNITQLQIYNISSDHNLTIPKLIEIDLGENSNGVKVVNLSNNNEYFEFHDLVYGERIKIDDLYCIESVNRPNSVIVDNFSGEFLKLINGLNKLRIEGEIKRFKIVYQSGKKIG